MILPAGFHAKGDRHQNSFNLADLGKGLVLLAEIIVSITQKSCHRAVCKAIPSRSGADARFISPHTLRHSLAMGLLQSGVDLTTIQAWLGHASPNTTHHYMEADLEMKRQALNKIQYA
jgi:site-specific recombinase XerD